MKLYRDEISEYFGVELQNQYGWQIIALEVNVIHSITILDYPGRKGNLVQHQGWLSVKFHAILFLQIEVGDNMLNYANLNAMEFEALCRDIMERMLGVSLRRFGPGKDGGVDLTDDVMNKNIIVQVKHYQKKILFMVTSKPCLILHAFLIQKRMLCAMLRCSPQAEFTPAYSCGQNTMKRIIRLLNN